MTDDPDDMLASRAVRPHRMGLRCWLGWHRWADVGLHSQVHGELQSCERCSDYRWRRP